MPAIVCQKCGHKVRRTRKPNAYNEFVRGAMKHEDVQKLGPKERMKKVAQMWHATKALKTS